ncbi:MarR family winged helix-turn-helix transcriptional regulator [Furfurilactobacillus curtus]|uniref:HTH marR-type domain-containing protein n=1 Tax=Furfurilactobacillus curtus TaxID=1746200 RepID=A0ABQ5JRC8_9LACO
MAKISTKALATQTSDLINTLQHLPQSSQSTSLSQTDAVALSRTQRHLLHLVEQLTPPVTNHDLSTALNISRPAVTKATAKLIKLQLLTSQPVANDHRIIQFCLTPSGQNAVKDGQAIERQQLNQLETLANHFDKKQRKLIATYLAALNQLLQG